MNGSGWFKFGAIALAMAFLPFFSGYRLRRREPNAFTVR